MSIKQQTEFAVIRSHKENLLVANAARILKGLKK